MLVELSVVEQRYHAVMEVISGAPVTEVARRYGVSRQSVHNWLVKYRSGGLAALAGDSVHLVEAVVAPAQAGRVEAMSNRHSRRLPAI